MFHELDVAECHLSFLALPQMGFILERLNSRGAIKYQKTPGEVQTQKCALHEKGEQNGTQESMLSIQIQNFHSKLLI